MTRRRVTAGRGMRRARVFCVGGRAHRSRGPRDSTRFDSTRLDSIDFGFGFGFGFDSRSRSGGRPLAR
ncbi:hypothetical protein WS86_05605 [Burkholderia savannae]|nr:hypothetical protein WS86_05605 [Burkholderia savannae]